MTAIEKSMFVDWINLSTLDTIKIGSTAFVMGWGLNVKQDALETSNRQRKIKVRMMKKFFCGGGPTSNILCSSVDGSVNSVCKVNIKVKAS